MRDRTPLLILNSISARTIAKTINEHGSKEDQPLGFLVFSTISALKTAAYVLKEHGLFDEFLRKQEAIISLAEDERNGRVS